MKRYIYSIIYILFLFTIHLSAQGVKGSLQGRIINSEKEALSDVNVTVSSPSLQGIRGASTREDGTFRILVLPAGLYNINISHVSHQEMTFENIMILLGKTTTIGEIILVSETLQSDAIVVTVERPVIDPTSSTMGANLDTRIFESLPIDRNYRNMATLLPQANTGMTASWGDECVNISGSTGF